MIAEVAMKPKKGDLVRLIGYPTKTGGIVLDVCDDLGIVTIDVLLHNGEIRHDQRIEVFEVIDESR